MVSLVDWMALLHCAEDLNPRNGGSNKVKKAAKNVTRVAKAVVRPVVKPVVRCLNPQSTAKTQCASQAQPW